MEHTISSCTVYFESVPLLWMKHIMIWCRISEKVSEFYGTQCWSNDTMARISWRSQYKVQRDKKYSSFQRAHHFVTIHINKQTNKRKLQYNAMKAIPSVATLAWHLLHIRNDRRWNCQAHTTTDTTCRHFVVIFSFLILLICLHMTAIMYDSTNVSKTKAKWQSSTAATEMWSI
jgi:hypothetical protein